MKMIGLVALLGLGMMGSAAAAEFSFGMPTRLTLARNVSGSVAIGDANGDGRMDLAVTEDLTWNAHQLSLFIRRADGSFAPPVKMALSNDFGLAFPVTFADLDADGAGEIMVGTSQLLVARFVGGALTTVSNQPAKFGCAYLASGDIDSDGKLDIVCHSGVGTPTYATLFYGDGAGGFRARAELLTGAGSYGSDPDFMGLQLADVTGDGQPDLLLTASRINQFFVYPNDGLGGISSIAMAYPHPVSPSGVWPATIEVLDLDGDGVNEVVTASPDNQPDAKLNIYRRGANGYLTLSQRVPIYDSTTALLAADVDGDGDTELVAGHYGLNAVSVLGAGSTGVGNQARFELAGFSNGTAASRQVGRSNSLALGDLNGDGCVDLASATYSGVTVLHGCRPSINQLPASDFDGDGVSDLIWRAEGTGEYYLWQWADFEAWRKCLLPCPVYKVPPWVVQVFGDFDGDGNSDVFWRNRYTGENAILLSAFYERAITGVTNQDWQVVGAGDFDGDDRSDLLWRNLRTGANAIWRSGDYRQQQAMRAVTDLNWQVVGVGDFNGDGRSDILWRHASSGLNGIWLSGRFETQQAITGVTNRQWRVQGIGDFNGDGKDDIAWRNVGTGTNAIWLSANYRTQQALVAVTNLDWMIAAVGDYNGDGRSDLLWRNGRNGVNGIWHSANFAQQQAVATVSPDWQWQLVR
jgi:hypothetical protein